jgi:hypothetical protein
LMSRARLTLQRITVSLQHNLGTLLRQMMIL